MTKKFKVEVSITKTDLPKVITSMKNYKPTLDFKKTYEISKDDINKFEIKTNKYLDKNQWSDLNALLNSIAIQNAFNDGMSPQGNLVNFKNI